jgi:hypothetical protein
VIDLPLGALCAKRHLITQQVFQTPVRGAAFLGSLLRRTLPLQASLFLQSGKTEVFPPPASTLYWFLHEASTCLWRHNRRHEYRDSR